MSNTTDNYTEQGGNKDVIGGTLDIVSGGKLQKAGVDITPELDKVYLTAEIDDISTAGSSWVVIPVGGNITKIYSVIDGAIASSDAALSFKIGGTAITGGGITVANSGSAAGDTDTATPTGNNSITAGTALELITDGSSTNTVTAVITVEITLT